VTELGAWRYRLGMRTRSQAVALAVAVIATLTLCGCVPPSPPVIPTAVPTATPIFASDADALAAAKKAYLAYLVVADQILVDGGTDPGRLLSVATRSELKQQLPGFNATRGNHWHSTGGTKIDSIVLQNFDPEAPEGRGVVTVYACIDVANVDVLDPQGRSVVSAARPPVANFQTTFDLVSRNSDRLIVASEVPWHGAGVCER
jgi:hypothetical protein